MTGDLTINGFDAYTSWGISLDPNSLSALMTPAPNKEFIHSKFRNRNGKMTIHDAKFAKKDERDLTLTLVMSAPNESSFISRYASFCQQLAKGWLEITTRYTGDVYRCEYRNCTQFSQYCRGIAKFSLKLTEPNPNNRGANDNQKA